MIDMELLELIAAYMEGGDARKNAVARVQGKKGRGKYVDFTDKEITKMPKQYRKMYREGKLRVYIRRRTRGKSVGYEVRCRMQGFNITAGGTTQAEAQARFLEKLTATETKTLSTRYEEFCLHYFETFRKRRVTTETYRQDMGRSRRHIFPAIGNKPLSAITPTDCQHILDELNAKGYGKTADEVYSLMNITFKGAIAHGLIARNPLSVVVKERHVREHGKALTKAQEAALAACTSPYAVYWRIALYTGLRPNEYATLRREGDMLIARNSKRKGGKVEYKRIPVNPMLAPIIEGMTEFTFPRLETLYKNIRKVMDCTLYDLRTTFYTRCRECGVADAARDEMVGHSSGVLADTYTDLSDEFLQKEALRIKYDLP